MIVFIGDSIPNQLLQAGFFPEAINKCVSGETPQEMSAHFTADVIDPFPRRIYIGCGTNAVATDADKLASAATIRDRALEARARGIEVMLGNIPPRAWDISLFIDTLAGYATQYGFLLVDVYTPFLMPNGQMDTSLFESDNTHPNGPGRCVYAAQITPMIASLNKKQIARSNFILEAA